MKTDGQDYLEQLASLPPNTFENRFSKISNRLRLGDSLSRNELTLLYEAAFRATLCNIAINGLGGCRGLIRPEHEPHRLRLEREFMEAREVFCASPGWQTLTPAEQGPIERIFLTVLVADDKLAW